MADNLSSEKKAIAEVTITPAKFPQDHEAVSTLFTAYVEWLGIDLTFQNFSTEFSSLPGKYSPSAGGALLVARSNESDRIIGCVALRALEPPEICELKRLYVAPDGRRLGAGRLLFEEVVAVAKSLEYKEMRLDTLPKMEAAQGLYRKYGFVETPRYYNTPVEETVFMSLDLTIARQITRKGPEGSREQPNPQD